ncbi:Bis(5'-nucleosyl)-tetraphosphatase PrpE [asymmetrical] [Corynebacterium hansenii]|nr:Bis(5'-nucleosyl)-tetraphosphatase PrpE [asymmetrical] [Corynebacterium hansenii]
MRRLTHVSVPEAGLVVLAGVPGAGKSTYASSVFGEGEVFASDDFREMVSGDASDQDATGDAFAILEAVVAARLKRNLFTVVDATNCRAEDRRRWVEIARDNNCLASLIIVDVPVDAALERIGARVAAGGRDVPESIVRGMSRTLSGAARAARKEGFGKVYLLDGLRLGEATVERTKLFCDKRDLHGPFDLIGDVHGCLAELVELLGALGYVIDFDERRRPIGARHPHGRTVVFVGDLVDRGPDTPGVLRLVMAMVDSGDALCVAGNHDVKLARALGGAKVRRTHGLAESMEQLEGIADEDPGFIDRAREFLAGLIGHFVLDDGRLVVAHAGLPEAFHGRASAKVRAFGLYGDVTGEKTEHGLPVRGEWERDYAGSAAVVYGHVPTTRAEWVNNTLCLDTGCVFGGELTALRYPERDIMSVPAHRMWTEPSAPSREPASDASSHDGRPSAEQAGETDCSGRADQTKPDLPVTIARPESSATRSQSASEVAALPEGAVAASSILGDHRISTGLFGHVKVSAERAAGALEPLSRFAMPPAKIIYLPPTMAPAPSSSVAGYLEHPTEALAHFRSHGVKEVVCEEKHMGSRAVAVLHRGSPESSYLYTRTGRSIDGPRVRELITSVLASADASGLWTEGNEGGGTAGHAPHGEPADVAVLDCELLPWSFTAMDLIRDDFAGPAAAGESSLSLAAAAFSEANHVIDGPDAGKAAAVAGQIEERLGELGAFRDAYRSYSAPAEAPVQLAPFAVLAVGSRLTATRPHRWHLGVIDRLISASSEVCDGSPQDSPFRETRRMFASTDPDSVDPVTAWWLDLTSAGGEGMVMKPAETVSRHGGKLVQPGMKVRGREYLRIIYGPDYLRPERLERLRRRNANRKMGNALTEYALGIEALSRWCAGKPVDEVYQAAAGVLAFESDPVDPRL